MGKKAVSVCVGAGIGFHSRERKRRMSAVTEIESTLQDDG